MQVVERGCGKADDAGSGAGMASDVGVGVGEGVQAGPVPMRAGGLSADGAPTPAGFSPIAATNAIDAHDANKANEATTGVPSAPAQGAPADRRFQRASARSTGRPGGRWRWRLLMIGALGAACWWTWERLHNAQLREAGLALYEGRMPVEALRTTGTGPAFSARWAGLAESLPAVTWRCINCHGMGGAGPLPAHAGPGEAPQVAVPAGGVIRSAVPSVPGSAPLAPATAFELRSWRTGPARVFDEASLCRLLRTGVSPSNVLISTAMPRYTLSDLQCRQLMAYLDSL